MLHADRVNRGPTPTKKWPVPKSTCPLMRTNRPNSAPNDETCFIEEEKSAKLSTEVKRSIMEEKSAKLSKH